MHCVHTTEKDKNGQTLPPSTPVNLTNAMGRQTQKRVHSVSVYIKFRNRERGVCCVKSGWLCLGRASSNWERMQGGSWWEGVGVEEPGSALHTRYVYLVKIHFATLHLLPFLYVCYNLWKCLLKILHA